MSKKLKLTPWFPGYVDPVRAGLYERDYGDNNFSPIDRWKGGVWILVSERGEDICTANDQERPWRGLAVKP